MGTALRLIDSAPASLDDWEPIIVYLHSQAGHPPIAAAPVEADGSAHFPADFGPITYDVAFMDGLVIPLGAEEAPGHEARTEDGGEANSEGVLA